MPAEKHVAAGDDGPPSVPGDVEVVTEHNFPLPATTPLCVRRLGFDARLILRQCMEYIDRQRRGEPPPPMTLVPAVFEVAVRTPVGMLEKA